MYLSLYSKLEIFSIICPTFVLTPGDEFDVSRKSASFPVTEVCELVSFFVILVSKIANLTGFVTNQCSYFTVFSYGTWLYCLSDYIDWLMSISR